MCPILWTLDFNKKILTWTWKHFSDQGQTLHLLFEVQRFWDGFNGWKSDSDWRNAIREEFPPPTTPISKKRTRRPFETKELGVSALTFKDICVNNLSFDYNCVYELNEKIDCFNLSLSLSETRQKIVINTFIFALPKLFLVAASFCIYHVYTEEKKCDTTAKSKIKILVIFSTLTFVWTAIVFS